MNGKVKGEDLMKNKYNFDFTSFINYLKGEK